MCVLCNFNSKMQPMCNMRPCAGVDTSTLNSSLNCIVCGSGSSKRCVIVSHPIVSSWASRRARDWQCLTTSPALIGWCVAMTTAEDSYTVLVLKPFASTRKPSNSASVMILLAVFGARICVSETVAACPVCEACLVDLCWISVTHTSGPILYPVIRFYWFLPARRSA